MSRLLLLFDATRAVIRAEKLCRQNGVSCKIIPVPKKISPECGMSIEIKEEDRGRVAALLDEAGLQVTWYNPISGKMT
jgi:hypothetical protein